MGGRGAASGAYRLHGKDLKYGDEYRTLLTYGNVKYVQIKNGSTTAPLETMPDKERKPKGRVYATIDGGMNVKFITFYDENGKKRKQLDLSGKKHHKMIDGRNVDLGFPHSHEGYDHPEEKSRFATGGEKRFARLIVDRWRKHNGMVRR